MDALARQMCAIGRRAYARELVDGTGGNFSCRLDGERVLCTPTLTCKGLLEPEDLCVVNLRGEQLSGSRPCSSEVMMHLALYHASGAVGAVVHSHPPFATTFAVRGESPPMGVLPEGDIVLGTVPVVSYRTLGTPEMGTALQPYAADHNAALLRNHGAVTWGRDLESAYLFTETLEAVCRIIYQARQLGGEVLIPEDKRAELAALRVRYRQAGC